MQGKIFACILAILLVGIVFFAGCAGYGQIRYYKGGLQKQDKLADMIADWENYDLYYSGMSKAYPSGLIFDPKDDDRKVAQKGWIRVESRYTAEKLVRKLERYHAYDAVLYTLQGEDGQEYGFIYTVYDLVVVRQLEEDRIHVLEMHEPPHLKYEPNGRFQGSGR